MANNRAESGKIITATTKAGYKELEKYKNALEKQMKKENSLFLFKSNKFRTRQEKKLGKSFESSAEGDQNLAGKKAEFSKVESRRKRVSKTEKTKASSSSKDNRLGRIVKERQSHLDGNHLVPIQNEDNKNDDEKSEDFALPTVNDGHLSPKNCKANKKEIAEEVSSTAFAVDSEKANDFTRNSKSFDEVKEFGRPAILLNHANGIDDIDVMDRNSEKKICEELKLGITKEEGRKIETTTTNSEANSDIETKGNQNSRKSFSLPEISVNNLVNTPKQVRRRKHGSKRKKRGGSSKSVTRALVKSSSLPDVRRKNSVDGRKHPNVQKSIAKPIGIPLNKGKDDPKKESRRAAANCTNLPLVLVPRKPSDVMPKGSEVKPGWSVVCRVVRMKRRFVKRKGQKMSTAWDSDGISKPVEDETNKETLTPEVWESLKNCRYLRVVSHAQT